MEKSKIELEKDIEDLKNKLDMESQVKKLESQVSALESDKHNLMCVIREKNIDWKKVKMKS